jgi:drug/metabolite transporter (DMT)-like permease
MLAYSLVIVATTQAPIGLVSALRETSVLFALLIGVFWLHETLPLGRICAGLAIVAGVVAIKLA